ncbi:YbdD/YjiX family protein [Streptomyces sp. A7024]|uniref:YbdD/YjiX family protein n=1 Tax=Streptomyces coryli TaxID=1128680 RepID=A0A6G4UCY3_9ACTN|nr:YbdD/YjiX family protein [Streptomyces coryli]NGN69536.1 YbdD/YjiX family protein [Streptomyces coryli]
MTAVLTTGVAAGRKAASRVWWYVRELTGETAYERYVEHLRKHDPAAEVPSRREFERQRTDAREADPREGNCCC